MKSNLMTLPYSTSATSLPALASGVSPCNGPDSEQQKAFLQGRAPVNPGVAQAPEKDTPTSATYGPLFGNSYEHAGRPLFSVSKSPVPPLSERLGVALQSRLSRFGSMEYGQTWKLRATPLGLRYWAHTVSGRPTSGSGCTGSRTPTTGDAQRGVELNPKARNPKAGTASLNNEAAMAGHPTPSSEGSAGEISEDLERIGNKFRNRKTGRILQTNLATDTLMLCGHPTPNCPTGGPNSNRDNRGAGGADLEEVANLAGHPTCSARDWKDMPGMAQTGTNPDGTERNRLDMLPRVAAMAGHATPRVTTNNGIGNPARACDGKSRLEDQCHGANTESTATSTVKTGGYRLNPGFSLWLMIGIPGIVDAWASCGVRAMQSCRRLPRNSSKRGKNAEE